MEMKRALSLLILISVVLISGCIGQGPSVGTNGIIIKDFFFDYSPIYAGDEIGLTLEVQNVGGEKGVLEKVTVFGVDVNEGESSTELKWGLEEGNFTMNSTTHSNELPVELLPPDPTTGFEGEEWSISWLPQAPNGTMVSTDYEFAVRVEFGYNTTFTGTIRVVESGYLRTLPEDEREKLVKEGGVVNSAVTGGPMSVSAASGRHFIVRDANARNRTIKFKITNIGSGYPYNDSISTGLYQVRVIRHPGLEECDSGFKMSRGKTGTLSCKIEVPGTDEFTNKKDKKFSIKLGYEYYVDSSTSITVNPIYE